MTKAIKRMTRDEIMVSVAAREIEEGDLVFVGQGYPILAAIVAKKTHAPNALFMMDSVSSLITHIMNM